MAESEARIDRAALAKMIDHTLLAPEATADDVRALCAEAVALGVGAVCVSPSRLPLSEGWLVPGIAVAAVVGFPSGAHARGIKAAEAAAAVAAGADEVDMVIDLGAATEGDWRAVTAEVALVRAAVGADVVVKAILETALIGLAAIPAACAAVEAGGADFVKTSTGFHRAGGASVEAVAAMAEAVGGRLGVKASGGIRTADDALAMVAAGATRIGASASAVILAGLDEQG
jgi:deoxyribose-phosphate aldolase